MKLLLTIWVVAILAAGVTIIHDINKISDEAAVKKSDAYIRDRVVLLEGEKGICSGVQVRAPSKKVYIITARHCKDISDMDQYVAQAEDGSLHTVHIVKIADHADIMLMTPISDKYVEIADNEFLHQHVHTITHGNGKPAYRTDGKLLDEKIVHVAKSSVLSQEDYDKCLAGPDQEVSLDLASLMMVCDLELHSIMTNASIVPGSSGGPALNDDGQLIGTASTTSGYFSGLSKLSDIKDLLKDK